MPRTFDSATVSLTGWDYICSLIPVRNQHKKTAYSDEEVSHAFQLAVEGSQDFGVLDGTAGSLSQLLVALEHGGCVGPAHFFQVVEASRAPLISTSGWTTVLPGDSGLEI